MFTKPSETKRIAIFLLRQRGWTVIDTTYEKNHCFELIKPGKRVAVKVCHQRRRVQIGQVEQFVNHLSEPRNLHISKGMLISTSGFSPSAHSFLREERIQNVELTLLRNGKLEIDKEHTDFSAKKEDPIYIGVFTCKGGVGKTTISAHLAGAFASNGYDVALLDLDRQENLRKLLGVGVHIPKTGEELGSVVSVFNHNEWDENYYKKLKIVVCDCNPEFDANPEEYMRRFDYCILPTTLNPLGINKNSAVIKRTLKLIRKKNQDARIFVLINNLHTEEKKRNLILNQTLKNQFRDLTSKDALCHYIDPEEVSIRFSKQLLYWGYHIFEGKKPELAFRKVGRYSYPRIDFLKLVDFLEETTSIPDAKEP